MRVLLARAIECVVRPLAVRRRLRVGTAQDNGSDLGVIP